MASGGDCTARDDDGVKEGRGEEGREGSGKERREGREGRKKGESGTAPASLQPCSGGSLLPALDQDSLECEARISIWGIGRNV